MWMLVDFFRGIHVGGRPALSAGVLLVLVGVQLAATGLIAELVVSRTRAREHRRPAVSASRGFDAAALDLTQAGGMFAVSAVPVPTQSDAGGTS